MRLKSLWLFLLALAVIAVAILLFNRKEAPKTMPNEPANTNSSLKLMSQAFGEGNQIPAQYTCRGQNTNPPLEISGVTLGAKSLALVMHDPDAVGGDFVHWIMWDMAVSTENIAANGVPAGAIQGQNGGGQNKYMGPCPPAGTGTHHYVFELYALDKTLGLKPGSNRDQLKQAMAGHILAQQTLTGLVVAQ